MSEYCMMDYVWENNHHRSRAGSLIYMKCSEDNKVMHFKDQGVTWHPSFHINVPAEDLKSLQTVTVDVFMATQQFSNLELWVWYIGLVSNHGCQDSDIASMAKIHGSYVT